MIIIKNDKEGAGAKLGGSQLVKHKIQMKQHFEYGNWPSISEYRHNCWGCLYQGLLLAYMNKT